MAEGGDYYWYMLTGSEWHGAATLLTALLYGLALQGSELVYLVTWLEEEMIIVYTDYLQVTLGFALYGLPFWSFSGNHGRAWQLQKGWGGDIGVGTGGALESGALWESFSQALEHAAL